VVTVHHIALVSESTSVKAADLTRTAAAIQNQVTQDFGPVWRRSATVDAFTTLDDVPLDYWPMVVSDTIPYQAEGIHLDNKYGPYALVRYDTGWSLTASHECLEMLADPLGSRTRRGTSPKAGQGQVRFLVEVCDPCEAQSFAYERNGVVVSDFYFPAFFASAASKGAQYSFTKSITQPRQILEGGYLSWEDPATKEWWQQTWFTGSQPVFKSLGPNARANPRRFTDDEALVPTRYMRAPRSRALTAPKRELQLAGKTKQEKNRAIRASVRALVRRGG
jgi:hypothetical protein